MNNDRIKNEIKNVWFKNHVATVTKEGDLTVLEWRNPKEYYYYTKYIFDGSRIYISGDIGFAIFNLTWNGSPQQNWNDIYLGYFLEKLEAFSDDRYDWNGEMAFERLKEWRNEIENDENEEEDYDEDDEIEDLEEDEEAVKYREKMNDLFDDLKTCENKNDWVYLINNTHHEFISDIEPDYWEWMYKIGDETPARLLAYLVGLQMASEQLRKDKITISA